MRKEESFRQECIRKEIGKDVIKVAVAIITLPFSLGGCAPSTVNGATKAPKDETAPGVNIKENKILSDKQKKDEDRALDDIRRNSGLY